MIGICFSAATTKNRRIPRTVTLQPAVESPKRVPDRQNGPALLRFGWAIFDNGLLGQPVCRSTGRREVGSYKSISNIGLSILCPRDWFGIRVVNGSETQLTPIRLLVTNLGTIRVQCAYHQPRIAYALIIFVGSGLNDASVAPGFI